jgi:hypothetical protein
MSVLPGQEQRSSQRFPRLLQRENTEPTVESSQVNRPNRSAKLSSKKNDLLHLFGFNHLRAVSELPIRQPDHAFLDFGPSISFPIITRTVVLLWDLSQNEDTLSTGQSFSTAR